MNSRRFPARLLRRFIPTSDATSSSRILSAELIETLEQPSCPLCSLAWAKSQRYVETLLETAVMDVAQRDAWRAAKGFCPWHAGQALNQPQSASSLAILYDDILRHELADLTVLTTARPRGQRLRAWLRQWRGRQVCPACDLWREQEGLYLTTLLDEWEDANLQQAFAASNGLCLPHVARVCADGARHPHLQGVLAAQLACLQTVHDDLSEFLRKQDYRFAHEGFGREADVWRRVVRVMVGSCDRGG